MATTSKTTEFGRFELEPTEASGAAMTQGAADQLVYMADLLLELEEIAVSCRCDTLAGLIKLAQIESLRQASISAGSHLE